MASAQNPWEKIQDSRLRELITDCAKFKLLSAVTIKLFVANFPKERISLYSADVVGEHDSHLEQLAANYLAQRAQQRGASLDDFAVDVTLQMAAVMPGEFEERITVAAGHVVAALALHAIGDVQLSGIKVSRPERNIVMSDLAENARKYGVGVPGYMSNPEGPVLQGEPLLRILSLEASADLAALYEALLPKHDGFGLA